LFNEIKYSFWLKSATGTPSKKMRAVWVFIDFQKM
jgi:hypothetical protein